MLAMTDLSPSPSILSLQGRGNINEKTKNEILKLVQDDKVSYFDKLSMSGVIYHPHPN